MKTINIEDIHCECCDGNLKKYKVSLGWGTALSLIFFLLFLLGILTGCATFNPQLPGKLTDPPIYADNQPLLEFPKDIKTKGTDCAIWATEVNGRKIGLIKPDEKMTQETWDALRIELGTKVTSGTGAEAFHQYWKDKNYNIFVRPISSCESYAHLARAMKVGCVAFREFFPPNENGHVEAILDVVGEEKACFVKTNSWGKRVTVTGFSKDNINHANFKQYSGKDVIAFDFIVCKKL